MGRTAIVVVSALVLGACGGAFPGFGDDIVGSGTPASEDRVTEPFEAVRLEGIGTVVVSIGEDHAVVVETDDNLIDRVTTEVRSGTLVVDIRPGPAIAPRSGLSIAVTTPSLSAVEISGAGDVEVDAVEAADFVIRVGGVGAVEVADLSTGSLTVELTGAGSIDVSGEATREAVVLSGVGDYDGGDLRAAEVDVDASGAGSVEVWAVDTLTVTASGVGSVSYWGNPSTRISATGVGDVESLGER